MKKLRSLLGTLQLVAAFSVVTLFGACSNSSTPPYVPPAPPSVNYFSQASLARRAYIGGSLIFNPDNSALSQLSYGAKIAVRTSVLEKKTQELYSLSGLLHEAATVTVDENGDWTNKGSSSTFTDYIAEKEGTDVYGYITITSVSKDVISFAYSYYPSATASLATESVSLKLGESRSLGSSGSTVKYEKPKVSRKGFENASWLTFVNSEDTLRACMYSCMPEVNGRPSSSLYGVNSDNDFIYIVGNKNSADNYYPTTNPAASDMVSYGDYIVDQNTYKMYAIAGNTSSGYESVMKEASAYGTSSDRTETFIDFAYYSYQFPDSENGPKEFFEALPAAVKSRVNAKISGSDVNACLNKLNWCLCDKESFALIAADLTAKGKTDDATAVTEAKEGHPTSESKAEEWKTKIENGNFSREIESELTEWLEDLRNILDDIYDESPSAYVEAPTMFSVYPDMALDLSGDGTSAVNYSASNAIPSGLYHDVSKSLGPESAAEKYDKYCEKRDKIIKQFKDFHQIEIINKTALGGLVGVNCSFGVKGKIVKNLGVKSGTFGVKGLGGALFVKAEANNQYLDTGKRSLLGEPWKKDLGAVNFSIGPIPCVFKTDLTVDFGFNVSYKTKPTKKYMAGVTALYGAEMDLGADWGVTFKWKVIPTGGYFNTWPQNRKQIGESAFFAGKVDITSDEDPDLDLGAYVDASLTPKIGLGVEYICAGMGAPVTTTPEVHYMIEPNRSPTKKHLKGIVALEVGLQPFMEVTIPVIGKKVGTNIPQFKVWDRSGDKAWTIFDINIQ